MWNFRGRITTFQTQVVYVGRPGTAQRIVCLRAVIEILGPGIGNEEVQTAAESLLQFQLQRVITGISIPRVE